jgi:tellurite resistance protein TehA-like permease
MLVLLFGLAFLALTLFVVMSAGVVLGVVTGLAALNAFAVILGVVVQRRRTPGPPADQEHPPAVVPTHRITGRPPRRTLPASAEVSHPQ